MPVSVETIAVLFRDLALTASTPPTGEEIRNAWPLFKAYLEASPDEKAKLYPADVDYFQRQKIRSFYISLLAQL